MVMKQDNIGRIISAMALFMVLVISTVAFTAEGKSEYKDVTLSEDDYDSYLLLFSSRGDEVEYSFDVVQGGNADFYIMSFDQYFDYYMDGEDFNASLEKQNTLSAAGKWKQPDDQTYYIIIDNMDNNHTGDATPTGGITYDLVYEEDWEEDVENFIQALGIMMIGCCALIAIVIIAIVYLIVRKRKADPVIIQQAPPAAYPQQPQQYQQAPPQQPQEYQQAPPQNPPQYPPQ